VELGYRDVSIMAAGIDGWIKSGNQVATGKKPG